MLPYFGQSSKALVRISAATLHTAPLLSLTTDRNVHYTQHKSFNGIIDLNYYYYSKYIVR